MMGNILFSFVCFVCGCMKERESTRNTCQTFVFDVFCEVETRRGVGGGILECLISGKSLRVYKTMCVWFFPVAVLCYSQEEGVSVTEGRLPGGRNEKGEQEGGATQTMRAPNGPMRSYTFTSISLTGAVAHLPENLHVVVVVVFVCLFVGWCCSFYYFSSYKDWARKRDSCIYICVCVSMSERVGWGSG